MTFLDVVLRRKRGLL
jgi:hypothetical protein